MSYSDQQIRAAVDAVFSAYDKDNSNSLDSAEVFALISDALKHSDSSKNVTQDEVNQFVKAVDKSGNNKIEKTELYEIFKKIING